MKEKSTELDRELSKITLQAATIYFDAIQRGETTKTLTEREKDFIFEGIKKEGDSAITVSLVSHKHGPDACPLDLEDKLRSIFLAKSIPVKKFEYAKVPQREFIRIALEWGSVLGRNLGYSIGDASKTEEYAHELLNLAKDMRASDIHIFPDPSSDLPVPEGVIKFRIDGKLREIEKIRGENLEKLVEHFHHKAFSTQSLSDNPPVIEGSFGIEGDSETQYRVASMRTRNKSGSIHTTAPYSLVIRLLKTQNIALSLQDLGYLEGDRRKVEELIQERSGFILVTGITGMGKTTTVMSLANEIGKKYRREKKVITFEDPVEYKLEECLQFQVTTSEKNKDDLTFELALKNSLRQDPDVIVIGEARTPQTGRYMVDIAQTGHLVLATMHSEDTTSALTRLAVWEIEGSAINDSLQGVISQVLIRRNCPQCRTKRMLSEDEVKYIFRPSGDMKTEEYEAFCRDAQRISVAESTGIYQQKVCPRCEGLKYYQRLPIVEIYFHSVDYADVIAAICEGRPDGPKMMKELFRKGDQEPFALNSIYHILRHHTSPQEVICNLPPSYFDDYGPLLIIKTREMIEQFKGNI